MATSSIFKSIVIKNDAEARALLDAIEESRKASKNIKEPKVIAKQMNKEDIKTIFMRR